MHYAQVVKFSEPPQYLEGPDLPAPGANQLRLKILAVAVHRLVQSRAAGRHFSAPTVPLDPSSDGVGVDEATGTVYYVTTFAAPLLAEYANVDKARLIALPQGSGVDPITVAALSNPVSSAWMALSERVVNLPKDFSVLILGVTGTSGRAAIPVTRKFGAAKVIGVARNEKALQALQHPAGDSPSELSFRIDEYVVLGADQQKLAADIAALGHVDVVLDYVYGSAAATLLSSIQPGDRETQYINIGTIAQDENISLSAQTLRAKKLRLTGSAPGSYSLAAMAKQNQAIVEMAASLPKPADVVPYPLRDIAKVWDTDEARRKRLVLLPGQ